MTKLLLSFFALAFSLWLAGTCGAQQIQNTLRKIQETKTIKLGYLDQSLPFSFVDEKKKPAGYSVELCQKVASGIEKQLGLESLEVQWVPITLVNRFEMVTNGTIDLECGISTITVSRQKIVDFSLMTWLDSGNFMVKAGQPRGGLADLAGKKIAVIVGTTTDRALADALKKDAISAEIVLVKEHLGGPECRRTRKSGRLCRRSNRSHRACARRPGSIAVDALRAEFFLRALWIDPPAQRCGPQASRQPGAGSSLPHGSDSRNLRSVVRQVGQAHTAAGGNVRHQRNTRVSALLHARYASARGSISVLMVPGFPAHEPRRDTP